MAVDDVLKFFENKRPWSRYKDLILDYYLKPYLAKVARLGPPIAIVDCFAGAGKFGGEEPGSPLIIGKRLEDVHRRGIEVVGMFILKLPAASVSTADIARNESILQHETITL